MRPTGKEGLFLAMNESYDALIVDRTARHGRPRRSSKPSADGRKTPVLFLSALEV